MAKINLMLTDKYVDENYKQYDLRVNRQNNPQANRQKNPQANRQNNPQANGQFTGQGSAADYNISNAKNVHKEKSSKRGNFELYFENFFTLMIIINTRLSFI